MALSDLMAGAGGAQGLEQLLTRRLYEAQLAEQIRSNQAREGLEARNIEEAAALRRAQQEESMRRNKELEDDRYRQQAKEVSEQIPAGSELGVQSPEARTILRGGLSSQLTKLPAHLASTSTTGMMTLPGGPQPVSSKSFKTVEQAKPERYRKEPTAMQAERDLDNQRAVISLLNLQGQRDITNELAKSNLALRQQFGYFHPIQYLGPNGEYLTGLVRPNAGSGGQTGAPGAPGVSGITFPSQPTAPAKTQIANAQNVISQIDSIGRLGDRINWEGVGFGTAQFQGLRKRITGGGSDEGDILRASLDSLRADIAHEKYGSAFTGTERQMLSTFAPGSNMSSEAIKNRLQIMKQIIGGRLQFLRNNPGKSAEQAEAESPLPPLAPQITGQSGQTGQTGVPKVGETFQGGKVLSVKKVR